MDCAYRNDLNSFLDGTLNAQSRRRFEAHLSSCEDCKAAVEATSGLKRLMQEAVPQEQDIWPALQEKLPPLCVTVQADLSAYFDGELPGHAEAAVGDHVLKCAQCARVLESIKTTGRLLASAFSLPTSSTLDLWPQIKPRLGEDCALVAAELSAYADAEVDSLRHRAITAHLTDCSACSVEFLRMTNLGEKLRSSYLPADGNCDLWPGIDQKLKVVPFRPRREGLKDLLQPANLQSMIQPDNLRILFKSRRMAVVAAVASVITFTGMGVTALLTISERGSIKQVSAETYLLDSLLSDMSNTAEAVVYEDHG